MMNPLHSLNSVLLRLFLFPYQLRKYFFTLLREYNASNFPIIETLQQMERIGGRASIRKITRIARANVRNQQCFASGFANSGYFTLTEEKLLVLGENYDSLANVIRIILSADRFRLIPVQIIKNSAQWLAMTALIIWISNLSGATMRRIAGDLEWFFDVTAGIAGLALPGLVALLLFCCGYTLIRRSAGSVRNALRATGLFSLHDHVTEHRLLQVAGELTATNIPAADLMNILADIFRGERWLTRRIRTAHRRLTEETFLDVLDTVISDPLYLHIAASAPNRLPVEISAGMRTAANLLELEIEQKISLYQNLALLASLSLAACCTIPFILITMGMTVQITQP